MPLNTPPFPTSNGVPYYDNRDANNFLTMPVEQYIRNGSNLFVPVSATNPQPTLDATVKAVLDSILAKILAAPATEAKQTALNALIGEVQVSPTANTLLARVKNLETKIDAIIAGTSTAKVSVSGSILAENPQTESDAVAGVLTFSDNITSIEIYNSDEFNDGTFTVNGIEILVPAGLTYKSQIGGTPATTVTITGATTYIVSRYE